MEGIRGELGELPCLQTVDKPHCDRRALAAQACPWQELHNNKEPHYCKFLVPLTGSRPASRFELEHSTGKHSSCTSPFSCTTSSPSSIPSWNLRTTTTRARLFVCVCVCVCVHVSVGPVVVCTGNCEFGKLGQTLMQMANSL